MFTELMARSEARSAALADDVAALKAIAERMRDRAMPAGRREYEGFLNASIAIASAVAEVRRVAGEDS